MKQKKKAQNKDSASGDSSPEEALSESRAGGGSIFRPSFGHFLTQDSFAGLQPPSLCIIGLGNPGEDYRLTRHNIGFWLLDALAGELGLRFRKPLFSPYLEARISTSSPRFRGTPSRYRELILVKPLTYMNRSGQIIPLLLRRFGKPLQFMAAVDNMDLDPGSARLKKKGGTAGHNGLKSLVSYLDRDFWPLYFGIGRPAGDDSVIDHVLGTPGETEMNEYRREIGRIAGLCLRLLHEDPDMLIQEFNTPPTTVSTQGETKEPQANQGRPGSSSPAG